MKLKKVFYYRLEPTPELKEKVKDSGILLLEGIVFKNKSGKIVDFIKQPLKDKYELNFRRKLSSIERKFYPKHFECEYESESKFLNTEKDKFIMLIDPDSVDNLHLNISEIFREEVYPKIILCKDNKLDFEFFYDKIKVVGTIQIKKKSNF